MNIESGVLTLTIFFYFSFLLFKIQLQRMGDYRWPDRESDDLILLAIIINVIGYCPVDSILKN